MSFNPYFYWINIFILGTKYVDMIKEMEFQSLFLLDQYFYLYNGKVVRKDKKLVSILIFTGSIFLCGGKQYIREWRPVKFQSLFLLDQYFYGYTKMQWYAEMQVVSILIFTGSIFLST